MFTASTHDNILFFTTKGRVYVKKGYSIPEAGRSARGTNIVNILPFENSEEEMEKISAMIRGRSYDEDKYLVFVTRKGIVKRSSQAAFRNVRGNGLRALKLDEGDELIAVFPTEGNEEIVIATRGGRAVRFSEEKLRVLSRVAMGVRGLRLKEGDEVIGACSSGEAPCLLSVTEKGFGKRITITDLRMTARGSIGVISHKLSEKTGSVAAVMPVNGEEDILIITDDGTMIRIAADAVPCIGRHARGVRVMRPAQESRIIAMAKTEREENEEHAALPTDPDAETDPEDLEDETDEEEEDAEDNEDFADSENPDDIDEE